jgi:hypothetical protein
VNALSWEEVVGANPEAGYRHYPNGDRR